MKVCFYSGGISSFIAAYRSNPDILLFSDTGIEDYDLYRFLEESAKFLGKELVVLKSKFSYDELILHKKSLPNNRMPFCSKELKVEPARKWINKHKPDELVFGISWDEIHRIPKIEKRWEQYKCTFPLTEKPYLSKSQQIELVKSLGLEPPRLYYLGFPHNNCGGGCVRSGIKQWVHLLITLPDVYKQWEEREKLVPGYTFIIIKKDKEKIRLSLEELRLRYYDGTLEYDEDDYGGCGCFID